MRQQTLSICWIHGILSCYIFFILYPIPEGLECWSCEGFENLVLGKYHIQVKLILHSEARLFSQGWKRLSWHQLKQKMIFELYERLWLTWSFCLQEERKSSCNILGRMKSLLSTSDWHSLITEIKRRMWIFVSKILIFFI